MLISRAARETRHATRAREEGAGFRWVAAGLLGVVGYLLNLLPVALSPGTDLIFGGVAYLLAAVALGPGPGLLAAAIASVRTLWLWNHPYAWLIFCAEAVTVGVLSRRWKRRPVVSDLLFWMLLGIPLLFLTYYIVLGVTGATAALLFLKQPLNGLIDALLVELLLLFPLVRRRLRIAGAPQLQSALAVVMSIAAILPALGFGIWVGRREWNRNVESAHDRVELAAQAYTSKLEQYVLLHERAVRSVAQAAERRGQFGAEALQRLVSAEHEQFPGFINMYAADSRGITVAFHPLIGPAGDTLLDLDFSDREYYRDLRRTGETVISDVFAGRGGADEPLVVIAHPIILADTFAGFVVGALDLKELPQPSPLLAPSERLRIADAHGNLILDTSSRYGPGERPRTLVDSAVFAQVRTTGGQGTTVITAGPPEQTVAAVLAMQIMAGVSYIPALGWWIWVEQPFREIQAFATQSYVRLFALLIAVTVAALAVSILLARYLARPLLRLRTAAEALSAGRLRTRVGTLPESVPTEVSELGRSFDEMAATLARRERETRELAEAAQAASRAKSDFIATMSHELRTPLNAVLGHLELLELGIHGEINAEQRGALVRIGTATRHLRGLIEEVLSFSQLEAGRLELRIREMDLCAVAREAATVIEPLAREKGLELRTLCEGGGPLPVQSDPDRVLQILINLAGNAVKFTEQGEVRITAGRRDGELRVAVRDTGIGIPEKDLGRLFQPFEQLQGGLSRRHGGTGLGLYLSGRYAQALGGRIEVSSAPGEGSEFVLVLPKRSEG